MFFVLFTAVCKLVLILLYYPAKTIYKPWKQLYLLFWRWVNKREASEDFVDSFWMRAKCACSSVSSFHFLLIPTTPPKAMHWYRGEGLMVIIFFLLCGMLPALLFSKDEIGFNWGESSPAINKSYFKNIYI